MTNDLIKQIHIYGHDFEYAEIEKIPFLKEVRLQVNYLGYPDRIGSGRLPSPLEAIKLLND